MLIIAPYAETITFGNDAAAKYLQTRCLTMRILMVAGLLADDRLRYRAELEKVAVFPQPFTGAQLIDKVQQVLSKPVGQ